jgi:TonB family protein
VKDSQRINLIELKNEEKRKKLEFERIEKNKKIEKREKKITKKNKNVGKVERKNFLDLIKNLGSKNVKTLKPKSGGSYLRDNSNLKIGRKNRKIIKNLLIEGNKISKGDNLVNGKTLSTHEKVIIKTNYGEKAGKAVKKYWKLPEYLKNRGLRCQVQIWVTKDGNLIRRTILESSDNIEFDKKALRAVDDATPLPPVPFEIREEVLNGEIVLAFPLP